MSTGKRVGYSHRRAVTGRKPAQSGKSRGKRQQPVGKSPRRMLQLLVSAALLMTVVVVKFAMPDVMQQYSGALLRLMGEDTDFVEAFSAVGRAVGGEELATAVNDAYVAVFGGGEVPDTTSADRTAVVYGDGTTPEIVNMLQQVLGFDYQRPVAGQITSRFGFRDHPLEDSERFHYGIDLACEEGEVICTFADGRVTTVAESADLGKYVVVAHADGYSTLYAHCSRINASSGQVVRMGEPIAEAGDTGEATGVHLHFELHQNNLYLNPVYYVS